MPPAMRQRDEIGVRTGHLVSEVGSTHDLAQFQCHDTITIGYTLAQMKALIPNAQKSEDFWA